MSINDRLKTIAITEAGSVSAFEKSIGVSNGYVKNLKKTIGLDKLEKIIELYSKYNVLWLLTGQGDMLISTSILHQLNEPSAEYKNEENLTNVHFVDKNIDLVDNLNIMLADKNKIIQLQDERIAHLERKVKTLTSELQKASKTS